MGRRNVQGYVSGLRNAERRGYADGRSGFEGVCPFKRHEHRVCYREGWQRGLADRAQAQKIVGRKADI